MLAEARLGLSAHPALANALDGYLSALKVLDDWIEVHVDTDTWGLGKTIPASVHSIFDSQEWRDAQSAAATLVSAAGQAGFSGRDFAPTP